MFSFIGARVRVGVYFLIKKIKKMFVCKLGENKIYKAGAVLRKSIRRS